MYRRRKKNSCLNCGAQLDEVYNYCPICGQENTDNRVNFKTLVGDFFNNYIGVDSRMGRSLIPFLRYPGKLTEDFVSGKRVSFMHPIRLYLVLSLFYFFVISLPDTRTSDDSEPVPESEDVATDSTSNPVVTTENLEDVLSRGTDKDVTNEEMTDDGFWIITDENFDIFQDLRDNKALTDQMILDSLNTDEMGFWEVMVAKQMIRVGRSEQENLVSYIQQNLPIMMFFMLPLYALILKLFYIRRSSLYIDHMVHALHLHAFFYFLFGMIVLLYQYILRFSWAEDLLVFGAFIWMTVYCFRSFRRVYNQGWFKTFLKLFFSGWVYLIVLTIAFIFELALSLLMY